MKDIAFLLDVEIDFGNHVERELLEHPVKYRCRSPYARGRGWTVMPDAMLPTWPMHGTGNGYSV